VLEVRCSQVSIGESGCGEPAVRAERVVAEQWKRGRLVGLDSGDDGFSYLGRVAGLGAWTVAPARGSIGWQAP
jgi:hypothetical protein